MKVVLIDDHALFREGVESLLRRRGVEVTACAGARQGIRQVGEIKPDVVMVDLRMPDMDGVEVLQAIKQQDNSIPVLILTTSDDARDLRDCLQYEASGYLLKDMEPDDLVAALRKVMAGQLVVAPELATTLASIIQNRNADGDDEERSIFSCLSPREYEVLGHLTEGQSNKVIARELGIADGTVKLHVKSILKKLGLHSRVEAAVLAANEGVFRKRR
jgi:two-component system nitrate/nitrite response regulator NarL